MGLGFVTTALLAAGGTTFALFSPVSPVSIDVARAHAPAGIRTTVRLRNGSIALTPPADVNVTVRWHRVLPWQHATTSGEVYEFRVTPNVVSAKHPATITLPLRERAEPGTQTLVSYRDSTGWVAQPATVGPDGRTVVAKVTHLSRWVAMDVFSWLRSVRDQLLEAAGLRTKEPPCATAPDVFVEHPKDPLAWTCVSVERGPARTVSMRSNTGFPLLVRTTGPLRLVHRPRGGGAIERLAGPLYRRGHLLLIPPGETATLVWDGQAEASVRVESEAATVVVRTALALVAETPSAAADAAVALTDAVDCLSKAHGPVKSAIQACASSVADIAEHLDLRHAGIRIGAKAFGRVLRMLGLLGVIDLVLEKTIRHREPFLAHLLPRPRRTHRVPRRPYRPTPPRRHSHATSGHTLSVGDARIVVYGCH
jgi:hypothetical protein